MRQIINVITFSLVVSLAGIGLCKDLTATLEDGRKILLKEDGTWEFVSEKKEVSKGEVLTLERFKMKYVPQDYESDRYSDEVRLILFVKNNSNKEIKAWKALMTGKNPFEEELFTCNLTSGASNIKPGKTEKATFGWEDNPFIDGQPYDKLMSYSEENLKIELSDIEVIQ